MLIAHSTPLAWRPDHDTLVSEARALADRCTVANQRGAHDPDLPWLLSLRVDVGTDGTRYRLAVGYDPTEPLNPWFAALGGGDTYLLSINVDGATAERPHAGYMASKIAGRHNHTPGIMLVCAFAAELIARRAETLHQCSDGWAHPSVDVPTGERL